MVVTADASPPIASNEPDPSGPTFAIEPAPSAPSLDISSDTGITSSTDTGSGMPAESLPDLTVGAPSDLPPIVDVPIDPPPIEGTPVPPTCQRPTSLGLRQIQLPVIQTGTRQDLGHGCRPFWCPRPPDGPSQPPTWPWNDPFWPDTSESWESTTTSCRRRAWCRHNGILRLPRRCSTGARRSPPRLTAACGSRASGISATGSRYSGPNARREFRTTPPDFMIQSQSTLDRIVTQHRETLRSVFG